MRVVFRNVVARKPKTLQLWTMHSTSMGLVPSSTCTTGLLAQDLSCLDYAALVASYNGSTDAAANCNRNLKRLVVAQHQYAVPYGPTSLVLNDPTFVGARYM